MIKCEITIQMGSDGELILDASMPEVKDAPELEYMVAEILKTKIGEWIDAMSELGDVRSIEGTGEYMSELLNPGSYRVTFSSKTGLSNVP